MTRLKPTLLADLDEIPPKLTRLIARRGWRKPLTNTEIAAASGLSTKRVSYIAQLDSWADVTVREVDAFRLGCGITPENLKLQRFYLRRTLSTRTKQPLSHLEQPAAKTKFFKKLLNT